MSVAANEAMTEDDEIVEAMARAMWDNREDRWGIKFIRQTWEQGSETAKACTLSDATAAYRAYRERMVVL